MRAETAAPRSGIISLPLPPPQCLCTARIYLAKVKGNRGKEYKDSGEFFST